MKVFSIEGQFGIESLKESTRERPKPAGSEIVVKMKAASLNYRDLLMVQGFYNPKQPLPLIPFSDGAGEVVEVGSGVTRWKAGDRVMPIFAQGWLAGEATKDKLKRTLGGPLDGVLSEYMLLDQEGVVATPSHLSDIEAACLPCAGVTAWHALFGERPLQPGQRILIQGTGGVSIFALQYARMIGAHVIITSSSDAKLERAAALGAQTLINYKKQPDWAKIARQATDGEGVDQIIEVGGASTFAQSLRAIRVGGQISVIGILSGTSQEINLIPILMQNLRIQGVIVGHREHFEAMNRLITQQKLRPVVDRVFPVDQVQAALEAMSQGQHFGKITLQW